MVDQPRGSFSDASGTPVSHKSHSFLCSISQHVDENSISRPTFSPGVHTDSSFARERPQSNRYSFSATPALVGSGSSEPATASALPCNMSTIAMATNDTATLTRLNITPFLWDCPAPRAE